MRTPEYKSTAPDWSKNLSIYEVNLRHFTPSGTFREFREHLPRLKELGVGIIWFMPLHPIGELNRKGSLGSAYSIRDYYAINPDFGTLDEFKALVKEIHQMGMYVIMDYIANHTAWDNPLTKTHPDFYYHDVYGNFRAPYPEWADVIHLNYTNPELRRYMIDMLKFWIREADVDGFRCDMAHLVPTDFWNEVRPELDKEKPVFMLAESENWDLLEHAFDSIYGWKLLHMGDALAQQKSWVPDLDRIIETDIVHYPAQKYQMLFTSNHDENAWNGSAIERLTYALEVINVMMWTLPGIPLIYSGQEAGNYRRFKFFDKDLIDWKEDKMFPFYKRLNDLKRQNPALWNGSHGGGYQRLQTSNDGQCLAFSRTKGVDQVIAILNISPFDQNISIHSTISGTYKNVFTDQTEKLMENENIYLPPWQYRLLYK
jgi:cyclomaltodextrinase